MGVTMPMGELDMNGIRIYQAPYGWIYQVCFMGRTVVLGCCPTLEEAMREAALA